MPCLRCTGGSIEIAGPRLPTGKSEWVVAQDLGKGWGLEWELVSELEPVAEWEWVAAAVQWGAEDAPDGLGGLDVSDVEDALAEQGALLDWMTALPPAQDAKDGLDVRDVEGAEDAPGGLGGRDVLDVEDAPGGLGGRDVLDVEDAPGGLGGRDVSDVEDALAEQGVCAAADWQKVAVTLL